MSGEIRTVLVVEDFEECAATLEIALAAIRGLSVHIVRSAEQALEVLPAIDIAALITDIHLPGMDGLELVSRIRRDAERGAIPIVVISGDSEQDARGRALAAGASAFFGKPYSPVSVRRTLEELIDAK